MRAYCQSCSQDARLFTIQDLTPRPPRPFSHDVKTLAAGGDDEQIKLWNVTHVTLPATTLDDHTLSVTSLAFSPKDGRTLASASMDNTVMLWDPVSAELRATLRGHTRPVLAVAFRADGKMFASTGDDGTILLWIADRSVAVEDSL